MSLKAQSWRRDRSLPLILLRTTSGVPRQPHLVFADPSQKKLEAANVQSGQNIQFFITGVGGAQTQVVRGGRHVALGQVAGIKVWTSMP